MGKLPNIRFKYYTNNWEQRKVSEVAEIVAGGTPSTKISSYWEPKEVPWLSSGEVHKKYITFTDNMISQEGMNNSSAKMIKENSVLIALAGQGKTRGTVAINRIPLTTNQSIAAMMFNDDIVPEFVFCNLEKRYDEIRKMSSGDGARGGLNKQLVGDIEIPYISFEEQKKIGTYFEQLDNLITLHQRKCDETKELKKYMLQKMFPKNGEKIPEIRFDGFTDDWEQRKLGDVIEQCLEKNTDMIYGINDAIGVTLTKEMIPTYANMDESTDVSNFYLVNPKCFVYNPRTHGKKIGLGLNTSNHTYIVTFNDTVFKIKDNQADENFLHIYLSREEWDKEACAISLGTSTIVLKWNVLCGMTFIAPSVEEQRKISELIVNLDNLITLHQRKCEDLKELKKYMLQNMFPTKG